MFIKNLKSQYLAYFLMSLSIGAKHIIKSFQGPEAFLYVSIDLVMVVALAFVLYTLAFCARMIWNRLSHKSRSRLPSIFAVLLIFASLVLCLSPNAEARRQAPTDPYEDRFGYGGVGGGSGGGNGGVARGTAIFIQASLLGAAYGLESIPERWQETLRNCRPEAGKPGVHQPRPECFWPVDALELAEKLVSTQAA